MGHGSRSRSPLRLLVPLCLGFAACEHAPTAQQPPAPDSPPKADEPEPEAKPEPKPEPAQEPSIPEATKDPSTGPRRIELSTNTHYVDQVAFLDDRRLLVETSVDRYSVNLVSEVWDVDTLETIPWGKRPYTGYAWALSRDRATVYYNVNDDDFEHGQLALVDAASGATTSTLTLDRDIDLQPIAIDGPGTLLATSTAPAGEPAFVNLWSLPRGKHQRRLKLMKDTGYDSSYWVDVALTSDGSTLSTIAVNDIRIGEMTLDIWTVSSGKRKRLPLGAGVEDDSRDVDSFETLGRALDISPNDELVAAGLVDHAVRVWSLKTGAEVRRLIHDHSVTAVAFSPDGERIASAAVNGQVRLWEVASGKLLASQPLEGRYARSVAFSPDGTTIAVGESNRVLVWPVGDLKD